MLRLDWNLLFNIINVIILYFLMKRFLFKPVNEILARRQEEIERQMGEAEDAVKNAAETKQQYEASMQMAEKERVQIVSDARNEAEEEYARIINHAKETAAGIVEKAGAEAREERGKILQAARTEVKDLVVSAAARVSGAKDSEENDRMLYDQFFAKAKSE